MLNCLSLPHTTLEEIQRFLDSYALESRSVNESKIAPELRQERMRRLLKQLGDPQETVKTIHIAGTTGKGSTCSYIEAFLRKQGFTTGLSLSPHVSDVRERFQLQGELMKEERYIAALETTLRVVRSMEREEGGAPGYIEFLRGLSYLVFAEARVDYAVVETGIGGLWDSSNTIRRKDKFCVITKLGLDHVDMLGGTVDAIAAHKIGIVQPGNEVMIGDQEDLPQETLATLAQKRGAEAVWLRTSGSMDQLDRSLLPTYLRQNAALAEEVCLRLAARDGWTYRRALTAQVLAQMTLPLRFELCSWKGKTLVLDAAHNPQKMKGLVQALRERFPAEGYALALAFNPDTDLAGTLAPISLLNARIACVDVLGGQGLYRFRFSDPRMIVEGLVAHQRANRDIEIVREWGPLFAWIEQVPEQIVVLTGSFHFVASARMVLGQK